MAAVGRAGLGGTGGMRRGGCLRWDMWETGSISGVVEFEGLLAHPKMGVLLPWG